MPRDRRRAARPPALALRRPRRLGQHDARAVARPRRLHGRPRRPRAAVAGRARGAPLDRGRARQGRREPLPRDRAVERRDAARARRRALGAAVGHATRFPARSRPLPHRARRRRGGIARRGRGRCTRGSRRCTPRRSRTSRSSRAARSRQTLPRGDRRDRGEHAAHRLGRQARRRVPARGGAAAVHAADGGARHVGPPHRHRDIQRVQRRREGAAVQAAQPRRRLAGTVLRNDDEPPLMEASVDVPRGGAGKGRRTSACSSRARRTLSLLGSPTTRRRSASRR